MKLNFGRWYTYLLVFAPILALIIFQIVSPLTDISYGTTFGTTCMLATLGIFTCYLTQFYLATAYFKATDQRNRLYTYISMIALLFLSLAIYSVIYGWMDYEQMRRSGPISNTSKSISIVVNVISVLFIYTLVTYSILNNIIVRWNFNRLSADIKTPSLKSKFLLPMTRIVRISLLLYSIAIVIELVQDIFRIQKV